MSETQGTCSFTSPDAQEFSGPCATQQELDELAAIVAVFESEVAASQQEVTVLEYCLQHPEDYQTCADQAFSVWADDQADQSGEWLVDTFNAEDDGVASCLDAPAPYRPTVRAVPDHHCANDAAQVAMGVGAWIGAKVAANAVMTAALPPPASAVGWAVFGVLSTGWMAGSAFAAYINCLNAH